MKTQTLLLYMYINYMHCTHIQYSSTHCIFPVPGVFVCTDGPSIVCIWPFALTAAAATAP